MIGFRCWQQQLLAVVRGCESSELREAPAAHHHLAVWELFTIFVQFDSQRVSSGFHSTRPGGGIRRRLRGEKSISSSVYRSQSLDFTSITQKGFTCFYIIKEVIKET